MKTIHLKKEEMGLEQMMKLAQREPLLLLTADGREFILSPADDFDQEVEALRNSRKFQQFLDERRKSKTRIPLEDIEKEIETELKK